MMEIPINVDVMEIVSSFTRHKQHGAFMLNGNNAFTNIALHQPAMSPIPCLTPSPYKTHRNISSDSSLCLTLLDPSPVLSLSSLQMEGEGSVASNKLINDGNQEAEVRKGPWTMEEDLILINYISNHGEGVWNNLARSAGLNRTGKSCRLRWLNYLRPDVRRGNITQQEQLLIMDLHSRWGNRWSKIARQLPGRTDNEIKNYWRTRIQKRAKQSEPMDFRSNVEACPGSSHDDGVNDQLSHPAEEQSIVGGGGGGGIQLPQFPCAEFTEHIWTLEDLWLMQSAADDYYMI
ncbi:hypothetical protein ZIOFF_001705 [Zingiber officinale]|uniref:Uncharacterized protein n=2 Tax=Zingiber officinale TaxID=94328 RepID=A0A8J5HVR8_ZINOF|nr:hypothetical protein ZIOFF_001705 [Zingiber officinale]